MALNKDNWPGLISKEYLKNFLKYSTTYLPALIETTLGLYLLSPQLSSSDFSEWAILEAVLVIVVSWAQLGTKFGYMQHVANLGNLDRRPSLRYVLNVNILAGLIFGLVCLLIMHSLLRESTWKNQDVLWLIPGYVVALNLLTVAQTDERITHKPRRFFQWIAIKSIVYLISIFLLLRIINNALLVHYFSIVIGFLMSFLLWKLSTPLPKIDIPKQYKKDIFSALGGALLGPAKYFADFMIPFGFAYFWGNEWSSEVGKSIRVLNSFEGIYSSAFLLTWGSYVYFWNREAPEGERANQEFKKIYLYLIMGFLMATLMGGSVWMWIGLEFNYEKSAAVLLMIVVRKVFFFAYFPASYGVVLTGKFFLGSLIGLLEFILTCGIFLLCSDLITLIFLLALTPPLMVVATYLLSKFLVKKLTFDKLI